MHQFTHFFVQITDLADQIVGLNMIEVTELAEILTKKLKLTGMYMGGPMMVPQGGAPAVSGEAQPAATPAKVEEKKEQTEFALKLDSFNAADKLKVCLLVSFFPEHILTVVSIIR